MTDAGSKSAVRATGAGALVAAALVVGIVLRVWLALVNTEANDTHLPVIRIIAFEHRFPGALEEWEAFQPKFYHVTVALVWRLLGTREPLVLIHAAQLVSCVAAVLTLFVLLQFLRERALPAGVRALAFALAALNPALVGISVQATNDAFVILFASLTLYFGARFFGRWRPGDFVGLLVAAVLAGISKGNGLVVILAVLTTFVAAVLFPALATPTGRRGVALRYGALFSAAVTPAVALIGPYASFQREFGTPFVTNWSPSPRPHLFRETFVERPGLTSVAHGLLTLRLVDLLRHPTTTHGRGADYSRHRTSLWSRIYAQTHASRFESWPMSWASESPRVRNLTRLLLLAGLLPTAILALGTVAAARDAARQCWVRWRHARPVGTASEPWAVTILLLAAALGHLAFVALYSVRLRDFSSMKQIFVLPALLAYVALFADGAARLYAWGERRRSAGRVIAAVTTLGLAALLLGYVTDLAVLLRDLRDRARASPPPPSLSALEHRSNLGPVVGGRRWEPARRASPASHLPAPTRRVLSS